MKRLENETGKVRRPYTPPWYMTHECGENDGKLENAKTVQAMVNVLLQVVFDVNANTKEGTELGAITGSNSDLYVRNTANEMIADSFSAGKYAAFMSRWRWACVHVKDRYILESAAFKKTKDGVKTAFVYVQKVFNTKIALEETNDCEA